MGKKMVKKREGKKGREGKGGEEEGGERRGRCGEVKKRGGKRERWKE